LRCYCDVVYGDDGYADAHCYGHGYWDGYDDGCGDGYVLYAKH